MKLYSEKQKPAPGADKLPKRKGWRAVLHRWFPQYFLRVISMEMNMFLLRLRYPENRRLYRAGDDLLVNVGCGGSGKPGWVNIDCFRAPGVTIIHDLRKSLPLADNSACGIFCEHFMEHLDYHEEVQNFVAECARVLRPGGVLRIVVPDGEAYLRAYTEGGWEKLAGMRPLREGNVDAWLETRYRTRMELVNAVFRQGIEHKFAYDAETLVMLLELYGFSEARKTGFRDGVMPALLIDNQERSTESLYVEAIR